MKSHYIVLAALLAAALLPSGASAAARDVVMAGAARCNEFRENRDWLECFYGSAQPMRHELGLPSAPAAQIRRVPPAPGALPLSAQPPGRRPGFLHGIFSGEIAKTQMTSYKFDRAGRFTVSLSNGVTYEQVTDDINYAHWKGPASDYNVTVVVGAFGKADFFVQNDGVTYKVHRNNVRGE